MNRQTAIQSTQANHVCVSNQSQTCPPETEQSSWSYTPAIDVYETPSEYTILCDTPGIALDQLHLSYEAGWMHLHAPVARQYDQEVRFLREEYGIGQFDRRIGLGRIAEFLDSDRITAEYDLGVLTIHLPKLESSKSRKITVKGA